MDFSVSVMASRLAQGSQPSRVIRSDGSYTNFHEQFLFPLFHAIAVNGRIHHFFYDIKYIVFLIQVVFASFWVTSSHVWPRSSTSIDILGCFIDLRVHKYKDALLFYIGGIVLFLIFICWGLILFFIHQKTRSFLKSHIYTTLALYYLIAPVVCPIYGSFLARSFLDLIDYGNAESIIFFTIYVIIFTITLLWCLYSIGFKISSPVIANCYLIEWVPIVHIIVIFVGSVTTLGPIFSRLPDWTHFVFTFCVAIAYIIVFLCLQMYPFYHTPVNYVSSCAVIYMTALEIMFSFRILLGDYLPLAYVMAVPFSIFCASFFVYGFWMHKRNKKILSFLSAAENPMSEEEKIIHFDQGRFENVFHVFPYIQLGCENHSDYIIDWSFAHYLAARVKNRSVLLSVAHLVAFFPSETNFLSVIIDTLDHFEDMTLIERYFVFQLKKMCIMRQNTASVEVNKHTYHLRKISKDAVEAVRGLWLEIIGSKSALSYSAFKSMRDSSQKVKMQFLDIIGKYSNNYEICDEYSKYLVEGLSDFSTAIQWERKKMMIEEGRRLDSDFSFKSFVNTFPEYLTKKIVDMRGNFIYNDCSHQSVYALATAPLVIKDVDAEYIDENAFLIDDTISQGRLRIAIQNAFAPATFKKLRNVEYLIYFQTLILLILFLFSVLFLPTTNNDATSLLSDVQLLSMTSINLLLNTYYQIIQANIDEFNIEEWVFADFTKITEENLGYIYSFRNNSAASQDTANKTLMYLELFLNSLSTSPKLSYLRSFYTEPEMEMYLFESKQVSQTITNMTFKQIINYIMLLSKSMPGQSTALIINTDERCSVAYNSLLLGLQLEDSRSEIIKSWSVLGFAQKTTNLAIGIIMLIFILVVFVPLQITLMYRLYSEVNETIKMLQKIKPEIIEQSLLPILLHQMPQPLAKGSYMSIGHNNYIFVLLFSLGFLSAVTPAILLFVTPYTNFKAMSNMINYLSWHLWSSNRLTSSIIAVSSSLLNFIVNGDTRTELYDIFNESVKTLIASHDNLLSGLDNEIDTIIGVGKSLNEFQFLDICNDTTGSRNETSYVEYIKCTSIDRGISYTQYLFMKLINKFDPLVNFYDEKAYSDLIAVFELRLFNAVQAYQVLMIDFVNNVFSNVDNLIILINIIGFVITPLFGLCLYIALRYLRSTYDGIKQMIRFIPPNEIINSPQLLGLILDDTSITTRDSMTQSQAILAATRNGVAAVSAGGIIETVNSSFLRMTGYAQEQILGQPLSSLFSTNPDPDVLSEHNSGMQQLTHSLEMMRSGLKELSDSFMLRCQLESGKIFTVQLYIIGIEDNENKRQCTSFLLMARDLSMENDQKKKSQEIKKKSETLIRKIVPPQVYRVIRMQTGSAFFQSRKATIIIIRINGLLEAVNSLLPQNVIQTMTAFFDRFDEVSENYPAVHQIMTTENLYIAACGLFDFEEQPTEQVAQTVLFALDVVDQISYLNKKCDTAFGVKFGINFGGPLYGSVLDSQTPQFNVYGKIFDHAMISAREAKENIVEVSQSVHDIIMKDRRFEITPSQSQNRITSFYELFDVVRPPQRK